MISKYQIEKAKKYKPIFTNEMFEVENDFVKSNKKGGWTCTCKFYSDGKTQTRPCAHILSVFYHKDKRSYLELVNKAVEKHLTELDCLRFELMRLENG